LQADHCHFEGDHSCLQLEHSRFDRDHSCCEPKQLDNKT
jgi:hypothetical protein